MNKTRTIRRNGMQWSCEYERGFFKHCQILIDRFQPEDAWRSSGRATVRRVNAATPKSK